MKNRSIDRTMFYNASPEIFRKAEFLRNNLTIAEQILWEKLRNKQLGLRFKSQHPIEFFIADFYCHNKKLVIEIDGHDHLLKQEYDENRTAEMEKYGLTVVRFTNQQVINNVNNVVDELKVIIEKLP